MPKTQTTIRLRRGDDETTHTFNFASCGELSINGNVVSLGSVGLDAYQERTGTEPAILNGRDAAERYVELVAGSVDQPVCFRRIYDATNDEKKTRQSENLPISNWGSCDGTLDDCYPGLVDGQEKARQAAYMVVNEGGQNSASIKRVRAVFVDADVYADKGLPLDQVEWHQLPSFVVVRDSNVSWQAYWLVDEDFPIGEFTNSQRKLAAHYGTDPSVCDLPRIMRVPGFLHQKDETNPQAFFLVDPLPDARGDDRDALLSIAGLIYSFAEIGDGLRELSSVENADDLTAQMTALPSPQRPMALEEAEHVLSFIDPTFEGDYAQWAGRARALMSDPDATPLVGKDGEPLRDGDIERDFLVNAWCSGALWRKRTGDLSFEVNTFKGIAHLYDEIAKVARTSGAKITWGTFIHDARKNPQWVPFGRHALPIIRNGLPINEILQTLEAALKEAKSEKRPQEPAIFRQSNRLVVIDEGVGAIRGADRRGDETGGAECSGVIRDKGAPVVRGVDPALLRLIASRHVRFQRWNNTTKSLVDCDCSPQVATSFLAKGEWDLCVLDGIVEAPTLRQDGSILQTEGYDLRSGLVVRFKQEFPAIPTNPSREEAAAALRQLQHPVRAMEFQSDVDRDVFVATTITGIVRQAIDIAPMSIVSASMAGSGKTIMAQAAAEIVTGHAGTMLTLTEREDENEKRLDSALLKGDIVIIFDNCAQPIEGNALCQVITNPSRDTRVLGESRNVNVSTKVLMIATGNNLSARGDMAKRALLSYNQPKTERPENRSFEFDLLAEVRADRPQLVAAALTLVQAYAAANRPPLNAKPTRFPQWDRLVRLPLIWAGGCDVADSMDTLLEDDPDRMSLGAVLQAWNAAYKSREKRVSEVIDDLSRFDPKHKTLLDAFIEALDVRPGARPEAKQLGMWLAARQNRAVEGLRFEGGGTSQGARRWRVRPTTEEH